MTTHLASFHSTNTALIPVTLPSPTDFPAYARAVQQQPYLSAEEEDECVSRWHAHQDRAAAWRLVVSHLRLVVSRVNAHAGYGVSLGDLAQEGTVGLMKAVHRFKPSQGVRLAAYAIHWIDAELREFIFRNWRIVRLSGTSALRRLFFGYRKTVAALRALQTDHTPISPAAIAQSLGVSPQDVASVEGFFRGHDEALGWQDDSDSYDDEGSEFENPHLYTQAPECVTDPAVIHALDDDSTHRQKAVHKALSMLSDREKAILVARRLTSPPEGLKVLGERLGVSAERVRQLESRAWDKVVSHLQSQPALLAM